MIWYKKCNNLRTMAKKIITYVVTVIGPVPADLAQKITKAHAAAVASRLARAKSEVDDRSGADRR